MDRRAYPSDVDDETYHFLLPYLALTPEDTPRPEISAERGAQCAVVDESNRSAVDLSAA